MNMHPWIRRYKAPDGPDRNQEDDIERVKTVRRRNRVKCGAESRGGIAGDGKIVVSIVSDDVLIAQSGPDEDHPEGESGNENDDKCPRGSKEYAHARDQKGSGMAVTGCGGAGDVGGEPG